MCLVLETVLGHPRFRDDVRCQAPSRTSDVFTTSLLGLSEVVGFMMYGRRFVGTATGCCCTCVESLP